MSDTQRDDLPIPDYDHLPVGSLASQIRSLDLTALQRLLTYEEEHGDRLPVVTVLRQRMQALEEGAEPTAGSAVGGMPDSASGATRESKASPQTQGPPVNPPSHGDPTNPAQPR
jgi:hypothetical protein